MSDINFLGEFFPNFQFNRFVFVENANKFFWS